MNLNIIRKFNYILNKKNNFLHMILKIGKNLNNLNLYKQWKIYTIKIIIFYKRIFSA